MRKHLLVLTLVTSVICSSTFAQTSSKTRKSRARRASTAESMATPTPTPMPTATPEVVATPYPTMTPYSSPTPMPEATGPFSGGAEANLNLSTGNTDIKTFGASLFGDYKGEVFTTRAKFNYMRNVTDATERALRYSGSLRLGANVTNNLDFFALGSYMHDNFTGVDDQIAVTPGLSAYAVNNDDVSVRFEIAAGWMKENYFPNTFGSRSFSIGTGGVGLRFKLTDVADITDDAVYILPFSTSDDWRINNVAALTSAVSKHVALKLSYTVERRNIAVGPRANTDTFSMASLVFKF